jgi:hypothetical protein
MASGQSPSAASEFAANAENLSVAVKGVFGGQINILLAFDIDNP